VRIPFLKTVRGPAKEKVRLNRRVATFLACVALSVLFWLMMNLSKDYTIVVSYPVEYVNTPQDKVISNQLPQTIDIEIRARGFFLLAYTFREAQTVLIDLDDSKPSVIKNYYYLLTNQRMNKITEQFSSRIRIQRVIPDTIFLNFNKKITKRVPVKANITMTTDNQYQQSEPIRLQPDYVNVSGAADVVDKVDFIETAPVSLKNVNASRSVSLDLITNTELGEIELSPKQIKALISVKKYTEGSIDLPVEAINLPSGYSLKAFPDKVTVKYNVAFDNYGKINALQFRAVIDYKKAEPNSNKLKVVLEKFPAEVRSIKLFPEKVEYILKK